MSSILILLSILVCGSIMLRVASLRIHIIPHSHIDQGWLRTVDGYQPTVFQILDSVVNELKGKEERTFVWGEVHYFRRWFESQDHQRQTFVKGLIQSKRFEFACGGWIENDYASVSYQGIIEQMTLGYEYLRERFGIVPRFGFDIDPFGYSSHVANLYSQMGIEMVILNRVHWKIKEAMKKSRNLEFLWLTDLQLKIFTHVLHTHYAAPKGFDFENGGIQAVTPHNVRQRANVFMQTIKSRASAYKTDLILIPWGDDFKFRNARIQYSNMDQLISYINSEYKDTTIKYSTISTYFDELKEEASQKNTQFAVVNQDFLPYADNEDSYWTGHFTTLPNLKKNIRKAEAGVRTTDRLYSQVRLLKPEIHQNNELTKRLSSTLYNLKENLAILYHHDAITGTCKRPVANDYSSKAQNIIQESLKIQSTLLSILIGEKDEPFIHVENVIIRPNQVYQLAIVNPTSQKRNEIISIETKTNAVKVTSSSEDELPVAIGKHITEATLRSGLDKSGEFLHIRIHIEAFSTSTFYISPANTRISSPKLSVITSEKVNTIDNMKISSRARRLEIQNHKYFIRVLKSGDIAYIMNKESKTKHKFSGPQFSYYSSQRSGSYLFRPIGEAKALVGNGPHYIVKQENELFEEIFVFGTKIKQQLRLIKDNTMKLSNYLIHSLFVEQLEGNTELLSSYFLSDSKSMLVTYDGIKFTPRIIQPKQSIASRFYPAVNGAISRGTTHQLTVINQHAMGVTHSTEKQSLSFMVHRRLLRDDGRGMGEGNNDQSTLATHFLVSYDPVKDVNEKKFIELRQMTHEWNHPFPIFVRDVSRETNLERVQLPSLLNVKHPDLRFSEVISFDERSFGSKEIIFRIHNLRGTKSLFFDIATIINPRVAYITHYRQVTLNLAFNLPSEKSTIATKFLEEQDRTLFDFTTTSITTQSSELQNSAELGVFVSDAALEEQLEAPSRKLQATKKMKIEIQPGHILSFILQLSPVEEDSAIHGAEVNENEGDNSKANLQSNEHDKHPKDIAIEKIIKESTQSLHQSYEPLEELDTNKVSPMEGKHVKKPDLTHDSIYDSNNVEEDYDPDMQFADILPNGPTRGKVSRILKPLFDENTFVDRIDTSDQLIWYVFFMIFCTTLSIAFLFLFLRARIRKWNRSADLNNSQSVL